MPTRAQLTLLFCVSLFCAMPARLVAQGNVGCVSSTDDNALGYRDGYGRKVSASDPAAVAARSRLGLPNILNAQVTIVSDTTTCRIASAAYDSVFAVPAASEQPLVLQLGTQYVVIKGLAFKGGRANVLFNQDFSVAQKKIWF